MKCYFQKLDCSKFLTLFFFSIFIISSHLYCAARLESEIVGASEEKSIKYDEDATNELYQAVTKRPGEATPMEDAENDVPAVLEALKKGANPNAQISPKKYTLLQEALHARWPKLGVIKALLNAGADPELKDYRSRNALTTSNQLFGDFLNREAGGRFETIKSGFHPGDINYLSPDRYRQYQFYSTIKDINSVLEKAIENKKRKLEIKKAVAGYTLLPSALSGIIADYEVSPH